MGVCYTKYKEYCGDVTKDSCKGMIKTDQVRKCTNVTELLCGLTETVKYEMATASYTVQKCHKVKERVCDTVYEPATKSQDDYHCIKVKTYKCYNKEKTMYDKTCRHVAKYNCDSYDYGNDAYNAYGESGSGYEEGYNDYKEPKCKTTYEKKCYETPRNYPTLECTDGYEKVCEKFPENVPYAAEKQACHDEEKRVCELEERQQPKQIKKYVYKKMSKKVPREICSSADYKTLVPSCTPTTYKNCYYEPKTTEYGDKGGYADPKPYDKYQENYDNYKQTT